MKKMENMNLQERLKIGAAYSLFRAIEGANLLIQESKHAIYHLTGTKHQKVEDMKDSSFYYYLQTR